MLLGTKLLIESTHGLCSKDVCPCAWGVRIHINEKLKVKSGF